MKTWAIFVGSIDLVKVLMKYAVIVASAKSTEATTPMPPMRLNHPVRKLQNAPLFFASFADQ